LDALELVQLETETPEYQYHLKDHLGNTRLTFTSKEEVDDNTATYEAANQSAERAEFLRYDNAKRVNATLFDRTNGASTGYAQRLNGTTNERYGLAKSIMVMPGDVINMEVYAKYVDTNSSNWNTALTNLMTQIAANAAGVVYEGNTYSSSTASFPHAGLLNTSGSTGGPKAYLNYLLFDKEFNFVTGGFKRLSATPKETGQDVAHERLFFDNLVITEAGYLYVYLSNENETPVEVFFDDFTVEHIKSPVVQADNYYAFGLAFNSYSRENSVSNKHLYNGFEIQDELDLGWYDYLTRQYDPTIGRFFSIDPAGELMRRHSPYNYAFNNPVIFIDPDGMMPENINDNDNGVHDLIEKAKSKLGLNTDQITLTHNKKTGLTTIQTTVVTNRAGAQSNNVTILVGKSLTQVDAEGNIVHSQVSVEEYNVTQNETQAETGEISITRGENMNIRDKDFEVNDNRDATSNLSDNVTSSYSDYLKNGGTWGDFYSDYGVEHSGDRVEKGFKFVNKLLDWLPGSNTLKKMVSPIIDDRLEKEIEKTNTSATAVIPISEKEIALKKLNSGKK
jgi:RHS repeat-associated protein